MGWDRGDIGVGRDGRGWDWTAASCLGPRTWDSISLQLLGKLHGSWVRRSQTNQPTASRRGVATLIELTASSDGDFDFATEKKRRSGKDQRLSSRGDLGPGGWSSDGTTFWYGEQECCLRHREGRVEVRIVWYLSGERADGPVRSSGSRTCSPCPWKVRLSGRIWS